MAHFSNSQEKLTDYKIEGQSKPFIDSNLQLQIPGFDSTATQTLNPIYCHYIHHYPPISLDLQVDTAELENVIKEAEKSYEAWKKMQQQLLALAKKN